MYTVTITIIDLSLFTHLRPVFPLQAIIWIAAAIFNIPFLVIFDTITFPFGPGKETKEYCFYSSIINMRIYFTINFVVWYAIPLVVMLFVYSIIAWTLWNSVSIFMSSPAENNSSGSGRKLISNARGEERSGGTSSSSNTCSAYNAEDKTNTHGSHLRRSDSTKESKISLCCAMHVNNSRSTGYSKNTDTSETNYNYSVGTSFGNGGPSGGAGGSCVGGDNDCVCGLSSRGVGCGGSGSGAGGCGVIMNGIVSGANVGNNNLHSFASMENGMVGITSSPTAHSSAAGPRTVYRNNSRLLMCWSWASPYDTNTQNNAGKNNYNHSTSNPSTSSRGSPRSINSQMPNYFELSQLNSNPFSNGTQVRQHHQHQQHQQRPQNLRQSVLINHSTRRGTRTSMLVNSEVPFDTSTPTTACLQQTCPSDTKPRYITTSLRVLSSRRKVVRMLVVLLITFGVCVLPHHIRLLMNHWGWYPQSSFAMSFFPPISFICLYLNSALNPVLYSLFSEGFRRSLREGFRKPWQRWRSFLSRSSYKDSRRQSRTSRHFF